MTAAATDELDLDLDLEATLAQVGPRLRQVRAHRGLTLTDVAARTGISKSTRQ